MQLPMSMDQASQSFKKEEQCETDPCGGNPKNRPAEGPVQVYGAAELSVTDADFTPCCAGKPARVPCVCQ